MSNRVQFLVSDERMQKLDELKEELGFSSRTELINSALTMLAWAVEQKRQGRIIASMSEDEESYRELVMPGLMNVKSKVTHAG